MTLSTWKLLGFDAREYVKHGKQTPIPADVREVILGAFKLQVQHG